MDEIDDEVYWSDWRELLDVRPCPLQEGYGPEGVCRAITLSALEDIWDAPLWRHEDR